MALRAAQPVWSGFVIVPKFCRTPLAMEEAMPIAVRIACASSAFSLASAPTAEKIPSVPVPWKPRS
jgi:hypothetical protein